MLFESGTSCLHTWRPSVINEGNIRVAVDTSYALLLINFFIKTFLTFTYKIEIKKREREKDTHTQAYIVQIEEHEAKHTHTFIKRNSYLVCKFNHEN